MNKLKVLTISTTLIFALMWATLTVGVSARPLAATDPGLGSAASFSVLAQTTITDVPTSVISGNVGLNNAGTNYSGLTIGEVGGTIYDTNGTGPGGALALLPASVQADASAAYTTNIPGQGSDGTITGNLDGQTFTPGVYDQDAILLAGGTVTLNGAGIYIFRATTSLTSGGSVTLTNGARACDVYWRVGSLAAINGSSFVGTILAGTGVHFGANVTLNGRALAVGGDVTLISDTITGPSCASVTPAAPAAPVAGLPATGGAPLQNQGFPLALLVVGGLGIIAVFLGVRAYLRTH